MTGVEIDMIVTDSLGAMKLYESIFEIHRIEATDYDKGLNEAVFTLYGTRIHLLDENPEYGMAAPKVGEGKSMWLNVVVPDIEAVFDKAIGAGCKVIQPITDMMDFGVKNAQVADPYGYLWMLHEIVREVSFEERKKLFDEQLKEDE